MKTVYSVPLRFLLGFRSEFSRFPDIGLSVIMLMNLDDVDYATLVSGVSRLARR